MTFEEFFIKKRIDLVQLQKAEPQLYSELENHFQLMGEKSFDHTKKFWFNKLRHLYHLETVAKEAARPAETQIASQAEALSSPTIEQAPAAAPPVAPATTGGAPAYKPKFRPRNIPGSKEEVAPKEEQTPATPEIKEETAANPPAKRPPFKPRNVKPVSGEPSEDAQKVESRPGQTEVSDTPVASPADSPAAAKPVYKPKFNIRNIPKPPAGAAEQTGDTTEKQEVPVPEAGGETTPPAQVEQPKAAYKPRFKMKNLQASPGPAEKSEGPGEQTGETAVTPASKAEEAVAADHQSADDETAGAQISPPVASEPTTPEGPEPAGDAKPKPAYKPRFNMKNIKPKSADEE